MIYRYNILLNKLIKIQLQEQKRAREEGQLGNSINYIPLLIFDLEDIGGMQYLSFIIILQEISFIKLNSKAKLQDI
jgi:hypothetical protein